MAWLQQSIRKTCPCPATSCYKSPELSGWGPPLWISIRDFNIRCHLTWKSCTPHSGGGGSEAKSPTSFMEHATSMTRLSSCWLSESAQKIIPPCSHENEPTCGACPTVKLVEQVCLDWKDKACKELFLLWQSAWRESSSETIAMKNSQYNTAGACLKWFYAAHEVLKLILCIGASFQVLHHRRIATACCRWKHCVDQL